MKKIRLVFVIILFLLNFVTIFDWGLSSPACKKEMNLSNLRCELFSNSDQETDRFLKAKEYVFKRDWQKARGRLEYYLQTYPSGQFRDEAGRSVDHR